MSKYSFSKRYVPYDNGFTIVELLVTIAIIAIISVIALPSLSGFIISMRVDNEISALHRLLLTTRNTAINSGTNVRICPLNAALNNCSGVNNWRGVIGVVASDGIANQIIKQKEAINQGDNLVFDFPQIIFTPSGRVVGNIPSASFRYCPINRAELSRAVDVSLSGRITSSSDIDGDGKNDRTNTVISC